MKRLAIGLLAVVLACSNSAKEDALVCAGVTCTAGSCISDNGKPACVCGAYEQAEGMTCAIGSPGAGQSTPPSSTPESGQTAQDHGLGDGSGTYSFKVQLFHGYRITVAPITPGLTLTTTLLTPDGQPLYNVPSKTSDAKVVIAFKPPMEGNFAFKVEATQSRTVSLYSYQLEDLGPDMEGDFGQYTTVSPGQPQQGTLNWPGDVDEFQFSAVVNHFYRFTCTDDDGSDCFAGLQELGSLQPESGLAGHVFRAGYSHDVAFGVAGNPGHYHVEADDIGTDDYGDPAGMPSLIDNPTLLSGQFEVPGDVDYFQLNVYTGYFLDVQCTALDPATPADHCAVALDDPNGHFVSDATGHLVEPSASVGGIGYLTVSPETAVTRYTLSVKTGVDDVGNDIAHATSATGLVLTGTIDYAGDQDVFAVPVQPLTAYQWAANPGVGVSVSGEVYWGGSLVEAASSVFYVVVSGNPGPYTVTFQPVASDDFLPERSSRAPTVALGNAVSGHIDWPSDDDTFAVDVTAGTVYSVSVTSAVPVVLTAFDGSDVYGVNQEQTSSTVYFTAKQTGTDYFGVVGATAGDYSVIVNTVVDDASNSDTSPTWNNSLTINGRIDYPGDVDVWEVPVTPKTGYVVSANSGLDVTVENGVYQEGSVVEAAGSLAYVVVSGNPGPYTVTLQAVATDDFYPGMDPSTTPVLTPGSAMSGHIDWAQDTDVFAFNVSAGASYTIDVSSDAPTELTAFDDPQPGTMGDVYSDNLEHTYSTVTFTAKATGTDYFGVGGGTVCNYSVLVTQN